MVSGDMLSSLRVVRPTHTYDDPPTPSPVQGSRGAAIRYAEDKMRNTTLSADYCCSYHSANPAYTIPNFQDLKQYSRPSHEISSPRSTAAPSMPMGRATQDRPREGDYWPTAVDPRRHERSTRGCLGPAPRPVTTSQAPPGPHYSTARHGTSQHVFRPMTSTRTAPISNCGQTVRLSNLPGAFSKRAVYQLLQGQGDVQVASCHSAPDKAGTSIAYATFTLASDARRAVEKLNGRSCENGRLAVAFVHSSSSTAPSKPVEESREKSFSSTTATQTTRGPLVVDGAKSTRPRYKGRHSPVDSDVSDDESHDLVSDSEDGTGSSGSDRRVAAVTRKVASMRVDRG